MRKINWRWPATAENGMRPGYWIVWCLIWFPIYVFGKLVAAAAVAIMSFSSAEGFEEWDR